jgi:hypothetical protein
MGGQTLGAIGWGVVAGLAGLRPAFVIPGFALLAAAAVTVRTLRLPRTSLDLSRTLFWLEPLPDRTRTPAPVRCWSRCSGGSQSRTRMRSSTPCTT